MFWCKNNKFPQILFILQKNPCIFLLLIVSYDHNRRCHLRFCSALRFCFSTWKLSSHLCNLINTIASPSDNQLHFSLAELLSFNGSSRNQENHFPEINIMKKRLSGNVFLTWSVYKATVLNNDGRWRLSFWMKHKVKFILLVSSSNSLDPRGMCTPRVLKLCLPGKTCSTK